MNQIHVEASSVICAPCEQVYAVLADYDKGHHDILPRPYFVEMTVEEGGQGAGTVILIHMKVMGTATTYRMVVSEPEPGRVLVEADENAGVVTTFTVDPLKSKTQSRLTIATDLRASPGIKGLFERFFTPVITRGIYKKELRNIAAYLRDKPA